MCVHITENETLACLPFSQSFFYFYGKLCQHFRKNLYSKRTAFNKKNNEKKRMPLFVCVYIFNLPM